MAYSTQKDFMHVAFTNEHPEQHCIRMGGISLKTYGSSIDGRAWSIHKDKQAQYLIDLVACRMYDHDLGEGSQDASRLRSGSSSPRSKVSERSLRGRCPKSIDSADNVSGDRRTCPRSQSDDPRHDSIIATTLQSMATIENLTAEKDQLKSQLDVSTETLRILREEKETLNAILRDEHYPEMSADLERIINQLKCQGKIDKNDEDELFGILDELCKREKAYKILEAQNTYLKRLVDKLSLRANLDSIPVEPETCTDVNYLQNEVNTLRKEVTQLRCIEDQQLQKETVSTGTQDADCSDAENIARIIAERNVLRDKCQQFAAIEGQIIQWKREAEEYRVFRAEACCTIKKKEETIEDYRDEIDELQFEIKKWEKCCGIKDREGETMCTTVDCLKEENQKLREELCRCNFDLQKIDMLQEQVQCLTSELCEKNCIIDQYDVQFQQLLGAVERGDKISSGSVRCLEDISEECKIQSIEQLAKSTTDTLSQISKELESKQGLEEELETVKRKSEELEAIVTAQEVENLELKETIKRASEVVDKGFDQLNLQKPGDDDCAARIEKLNQIIKEQQEKEAQWEAEKSKLESEKAKLEAEKDAEKNAKLSAERDAERGARRSSDQSSELDALREKLRAQEKLLSEAEQRAKDLESKLNEANKLAQDISGVQNRNENLETVLGADAEKSQQEIDSLKKQLEELRKQSGGDSDCLKELEDLKSQLAEERKKSETIANDYKKLQNLYDAKAVETEHAPKEDTSARPVPTAKEERVSAVKLAQVQKKHQSDVKNYEREIEGHRLSNQVLQQSLTKLTAKMEVSSAEEFEKDFRKILDCFVHEICKWRCKNICKRLSKIQEIAKKIVEMGIESLNYKELAYLHQQMSEAASRLKPKYGSQEVRCCKCSGEICYVPMVPKDSEKVLLDKLSVLERDIQSARGTLRRLKEQQDLHISAGLNEPMQLDTLRPSNTFRLTRATGPGITAPFGYRTDFDQPTNDKCGF